MKKEEEKSKGKLESTNKSINLNAKESDKAAILKPEIKGEPANYAKVDESPVKMDSKKPTLKVTYRDLFAKEASRLSGSKFEGDPTIEAANGHPLLLKYYQNWLNCEAE
jgi:hypothetical protein